MFNQYGVFLRPLNSSLTYGFAIHLYKGQIQTYPVMSLLIQHNKNEVFPSLQTINHTDYSFFG